MSEVLNVVLANLCKKDELGKAYCSDEVVK